MMTATHSGRLELALHLADLGREQTLRVFRAGQTGLENKAHEGFDPVTDADREAERVMRAAIEKAFPEDGIEGEEFGSRAGVSGYVWYLDPVDGTRAFIAGLPVWTILIGLVREGVPVVGVIDQPLLDERYVGADGEAWLLFRGERIPLSVRPDVRLTSAILATTDPFIFSAPERGAFDQVRAAARLTRYGLDAYAYARLSAGTIDIVIESGLKSHDVAALIPVIEGAGGIVADWRGERAELGGQIVAAANRALLDDALIALRRSAVNSPIASH